MQKNDIKYNEIEKKASDLPQVPTGIVIDGLI